MIKHIIMYKVLFGISFIGFVNASDIENDKKALQENLCVKYSMKTAVYDNVENLLYAPQNVTSNKNLTYNLNITEVKKAIEYLQLIAKPSDKFPPYHLSPIELRAHLHLVRAGLHFINGTFGLPTDVKYGLEILEFYILYRHSIYKDEILKNVFPKIRKNPEKYDSVSFFDELSMLSKVLEKKAANIRPLSLVELGSIASRQFLTHLQD